MSLQETIRIDMKEAMMAKDELRLRVLRSLVTLFTQELTATKRTPRDELSDEEVLTLIRRSVKQRNEAATQFRAGKREDLVENEEAESKVLEAYLPQMLSKDEVLAHVEAKMKDVDVSDKSTMGKSMGMIMAELKGKADGALVKEVIESFYK
jgi:uncharacterized protein